MEAVVWLAGWVASVVRQAVGAQVEAELGARVAVELGAAVVLEALEAEG